MKSADEMHAADEHRRTWIPMLEMATREVFELMVGSELALPGNAEGANLDVTAMVGLAGQLCGVLSVRCEGMAAALIASKMLGVELHQTSPEMSDALGEIANMVAGNFKSKISGLAENCLLSPPTVITGHDYSLHPKVDSGELEVRLLFESMPLVISLQVHSQN
ncbi:MAG: chemotaxis protein CheX [Terriglobales bacterium]|jgi:chemotaxis protein CheX